MNTRTSENFGELIGIHERTGEFVGDPALSGKEGYLAYTAGCLIVASNMRTALEAHTLQINSVLASYEKAGNVMPRMARLIYSLPALRDADTAMAIGNAIAYGIQSDVKRFGLELGIRINPEHLDTFTPRSEADTAGREYSFLSSEPRGETEVYQFST